jgi:hypothetical protein
MDIYGTCLWHLGKTTELSFLGNELKEIHKDAPQTWYLKFKKGALSAIIIRI